MRIRAGALLAICLVAAVTACGFGSSGQPASSSRRAATPTPSPAISAEWTEYHRNSGRSGLGPAEPALSSPHPVWTTQLDGDIYASPLIVAGHVIVATENDTVYSLDLFTGSAVWKTHLGTPVTASSLDCGDISPYTGITGTPAADPAKGRVYVVAFLNGNHHMLFVLSLVDGAVVSQQDVDPPGSSPAVQQQRGALALGSGMVYVPLGGLYGDCGPYHGYVVAVPVAGGQAMSYRVPSSRGAGIWSPQGATIGPDGSVYVVTGNGESRSNFDYSNAVVQLSPDLQSVRSFFAPSNWASLNASDTDLGSVGAAVLPAPGLVVAIGKQGVAYVLKAGSLGGVGGQLASQRVCTGAWGGSAWAGTTIFVPCANGLVALSAGAGSINVLWQANRPRMGSPILSAGAVWAIEPDSATLYALDPSSGKVVYSTGLGSAEHFSTPAATDGFVVAPAGRSVVAILTLA